MSLQTLEQSLIEGISAAADETELESLRVSALGKKGAISERMKTLSDMTPDERKTAGAELNALKEKITEAIAAKKAGFQAKALEARLVTEKIDVTLPVRPEMLVVRLFATQLPTVVASAVSVVKRSAPSKLRDGIRQLVEQVDGGSVVGRRPVRD